MTEPKNGRDLMRRRPTCHLFPRPCVLAASSRPEDPRNASSPKGAEPWSRRTWALVSPNRTLDCPDVIRSFASKRHLAACDIALFPTQSRVSRPVRLFSGAAWAADSIRSPHGHERRAPDTRRNQNSDHGRRRQGDAFCRSGERPFQASQRSRSILTDAHSSGLSMIPGHAVRPSRRFQCLSS